MSCKGPLSSFKKGRSGGMEAGGGGVVGRTVPFEGPWNQLDVLRHVSLDCARAWRGEPGDAAPDLVFSVDERKESAFDHPLG